MAALIWYDLLDRPREVGRRDSQHGSLLGPSYANGDIGAFLDRAGAVYRLHDSDASLLEEVSDHLASERVVGWLSGPMEFGPRALGSRSILGDARSPRMQSVMNLKIKFRESFRPFAPAVLRSRVHDYFETRVEEDSPYMLLVAGVRPERRTDGADDGLRGLDKLKLPRSEIPAVTHVDYSARIQTVDPERHGRFHDLLRAFEAKTGCPVLINTSFNVRGEPIVMTPEDAYRCFMATQMDVLVLERYVLEKSAQPSAPAHATDAHLARFELD